MSRQDLALTLPWLRDGTAFLMEAVDRLADAEFAAPSALPDWTRAHVIGHLARNAEALGRLVSWARTAVETPMYGSREQRAAKIEASAALPPATLRHDLTATAARLDEALAGLDSAAWQAQVRSALGRPIPATEIPWLRVREVWLHAVDLSAGAGVADLPPDLVDALLDDATDALSARSGCPPVRLAPADRDREWRLGPASAPPVDVRGTAAQLLAWAIGRDSGTDLPIDDGRGTAASLSLPPWL